jgi:hypothetical protein
MAELPAVPKRSIPEQSPINGRTIICSGCGKEMKMEVVMNRRGVDHLKYSCSNEERGCSYSFENKEYVNAELKGIRKDGSEVKVPEAVL